MYKWLFFLGEMYKSLLTTVNFNHHVITWIMKNDIKWKIIMSFYVEMIADFQHGFWTKKFIKLYFQILTDLSWLAEATIPVTGDCAKADITQSWAATVIHLFSVMFQISIDCKH